MEYINDFLKIMLGNKSFHVTYGERLIKEMKEVMNVKGREWSSIKETTTIKH